MESYDRRMSALRQGEYLPPADDSYDPEADMKALSGAHKKKAVEHESYMSKEQLMELRRVQHERIEVGYLLFRVISIEILFLGWENEAVRYGCKTEYGCQNGRDYVRWVIKEQ